nr:phosphatidylinositol phosphatase PTPRQ-like isoform X1 [Hydra vulgaris]
MLVFKLLMLLVVSKKFNSEDVQECSNATGKISECTPGPAENVLVEKRNDSSVTINWNEPSVKNGTVKYRIFYEPQDDSNKIQSFFVETNETFVIVVGLKDYTNYTFFIQAFTACGNSTSVANTSAMTYFGDARGGPVNLTVAVVSSSSVNVSWTRPDDSLHISGYEVFYLDTSKRVDVFVTWLLVENLNPCTVYKFNVCAIYPEGKTNCSIKTEKIAGDAPGPAENVLVEKRNDSSVTINWNEPSVKNGTVKYRIFYEPQDDSNKIQSFFVETNETFVIVVGLKDYTNYTFFIQAFTACGNSTSVANTSAMTYFGDARGGPVNLTVAVVSSSSVNVSWTRPDDSLHISGYEVFYLDTSKRVDVFVTWLLVENLNPCTVYKFNVCAIYPEGKTNCSIKTEKIAGDAPGPAENVLVEKRNDSSVTINWNEPSVKNGTVKYRIFYEPQDDSNKIQSFFVETNETFVIVVGLKDYTNYTFFIQAFTACGNSTSVANTSAMTYFGDARGGPVNLTVAVVSSSSVNVSWTRPDDSLHISGYEVFYLDTSKRVDVFVTWLLVENLNPCTVYKFNVCAIYPEGKTNCSIKTEKIAGDAPGPAENVLVEKRNDSSVTINWNEPSVKNGTVKYRIFYEPQDDSNKIQSFFVETNETFVIVVGLKDYTNYTFFIQAFTACGNSTSVANTSAMTYFGDARGGPVNLTVAVVSSSSVNVSWTRPDDSLHISGYEVFYLDTSKRVDVFVTWLLVENLNPCTVYKFNVCAIYPEGKTNCSIKTEKIAGDAPGPAENVLVEKRNDSSVTINWNEPSVKNGTVKYRIFYEPQDDSNKIQSFFVETNETFVIVVGLKDYTNYTFFIQAFTACGNSTSVANTSAMTYFGDARGGPVNLTVAVVSSSSVNVSWTRPDDSLHISGYEVFYLDTSKRVDVFVTWLLVENLNPCTVYKFNVCAIYPEGKTNCSIKTEKIAGDAPGPAENVLVEKRNDSSVTINWNEPSVKNGTVKYRIFYEPQDDSNKIQSFFVETNETFVIVVGLKDYTNYTFFIQAFTACGNSTSVANTSAMTYFGDARGGPVNLTVAVVSSSSVNVSWTRPDDSLHISGYEVFYLDTSKRVDVFVTWLLVENLNPCTVYKFNVCAIYPEGKTSCFHIEGKTLEDIPDEPGSFLCFNGREGSKHFIFLNWTKPLFENGILLDYIIYRNNHQVFKNLKESFKDAELKPYTQYSYTLAASTKVGYGKNKSLSCTTQEDIPDEPSSFFCFNGREDSKHFIFLNWTKPLFANGILLNYILYRNNDEIFKKSGENFKDEEELKPYTQYNYTLAASTIVGYGKNKSISCQTQEDRPSKVVSLTASKITHSSLCLEWRKPENPNGEVIYSITCNTFENKTKNLYYCYNNLHAYTRYQVFVSACTYGGDLCSEKQDIIVTTDFTAPSECPAGILPKKTNPTSINLIWNPPKGSAENGPYIHYVIKYWANDVNETKLNINNTEVALTSLKFYTNYTITFCACNKKGCGPICTINEETGEGIPGPPLLLESYVNGTSETNISIGISWKTPKQPNGKLLGFRLKYMPSFSKDRTERKPIELGNVLQYDINGLEPYTLYNVSLAAVTSVGVGDYDFKQYHTKSVAPGPPTAIAFEKTSTTIKLSWRPPEKPNGKILKYLVSNKTTGIVIGETESLFFEIKKLKSYTEYSFSISCVSEHSQGPYECITVRTSETIPPLPPTVSPPSEPPTSKTITIRISQGSNENGRISYYLIVVIETINGRPNKKPKEYDISDLKTYEEYIALRKTDSFVPYIAANISSDKFPKDGTFVLGSGTKNQARKRRSAAKVYHNGPLSSGRSYCVFQRTHVNQDLYVSSEDWDGPYKTEVAVVNIPKEGGDGGKIAGGIIGVLIALIFGGALYYFKFRNKGENKIESQNLNPLMKGSFNKGFDPDNGNLKLDPYTPSGVPIKVSNFPAYVRNLSKDGKFLFAEEFKLIQQGKGVSSYLYEHSNHPINREKNRYNNIVAYDHTRVLLRPIDDIPESDYINANYIDGYMGHGYIATQGPLEQTCQDFWRMCWEQNVSTIVMLTQLVEQGKNKCHKYWPDVGSTCYDMMQITLTESTCLPSYVVRTFSVLHDEYPGQERFIKQFAFNSWSDHGISNPQTLLTFIRHVNQSIANSDGPSGPVVVHCSAGVGRTGTYIVLDVNLKQIEAEGKVEIFKYLQHIRSQRNYMVQTEGQYIFIHDTLLEHIIFGVTEVQVQDLRNHVKKMLQTQTGSTETRIDKEFHKLNLFDPSNTKTIKAASETCNRNKNRYYNVLPYDDTRVCLKPMPGVAGSDYINASFINGYTQEKQFIASQAPLPQTIVSFWRMVWEYDCRTIVCLAQETEGGKVKIHRYWPSIEGAMHGTLMIEHVSQNIIGDFIVREFKVTHTTEGHSRTIKHFQYVTWPDNSHPESGSSIVDMIGRVQKWNQQNGTGPIVVHCSNGVGRTGVFIALFNVIDRVRVEGVVDIFQTVRELRSQRPAMVQTKDQYLFCFLAFQDFLASFDIYQTFL